MIPIVLEVDPVDWHDAAVDQIHLLAMTREFFTCEDLRPLICEPAHPNHWGAAFLTASRRRLITRWDSRPSRTRSRRGGSLAVWVAHPSLGRAA